MIDIAIKQRVSQLIGQLLVFSNLEISEMLDRKTSLWKKIKKNLQRSIAYSFDEEFQNRTNNVLKKIDETLKTKQAHKFIQKAKQKLIKFPLIIIKIIKQYEQLSQEEYEKLQEIQFRQKLFDSVLEKEIKNWKFSQLNQIIQSKWKQLQHKKFHYMTLLEKETFKACKQFRDFCQEQNFDLNLLDKVTMGRIEFGHNDSLNWSEMSSISCYSLKTNENNSIDQNESINQTSNKILVCLEQKQKQLKITQSSNFTKAQDSSYLIYDVEKSNNSNSIVRQIQIKKQCSEDTQNIQSLDFFSISKKKEKQNKYLYTPQQPKYKNQNVHSQEQNSHQEISATINNSILQDEQKKLFQQYSESIIKRYSSQSRFTEGEYKNLRQREVDNIMKNQYKPLINFLQKLPIKDIDPTSSNNDPVQVQVYGSFKNKCGFRKISDLNINLNVKGLRDGNISNCLFHLKKRLDFYRQKGYLTELSLRSITCNKQNGQIILSHTNNIQKYRDQSVINFIFITINKKQYVENTWFMKEVVYNNEQKCQDIAHLVNFLHLLFKRNQILDHKDVYHIWWTKNPEQQKQKKISQNRYVSISVYALHMMILFYLQETTQISRIKYNKEIKKYDFQLINNEITLYERLIKFLQFYSEEGEYKRLYENEKKNIIDIVQRTGSQQSQVIFLIQSQLHKIQSNIEGYLFAFVNPMISDFIEASNGKVDKKYITFEVKKGSVQQKLFFRKINEMREKITKMRGDKDWDANNLISSWNDY